MKLAELFIEFTTKGVEAVHKAAEGVHSKLGAIVGVAGGVGKALALMAGGVVGLAAGFTGAALAGSSQWQVLSDIMERLVNTVGSAFLPLIELVMDVLEDMIPIAEKFGDTLQPAIQELADAFWEVWRAVEPSVAAMAEFGTNFLVTITEVIAKIIHDLIPVLKWIAEWMTWLFQHATSGLNIVREAAGLDAVKRGGSQRRITPAAGGFEDVTAVYNRIAQASLRASRGGKTTAERQLDEAQQHTQLLDGINKGVNNIRPAYV